MGSQFGALVGGLWGDAGQNFVDLQGGPKKVFGRKPKVVDFTPTDLSEEIGKTTAANLENYDSIAAMLEKMLPGFGELVKTGLDTSGAMLRGEIPEDVQEQIMRDGAFQSMMGGYSGTGMNRNLVARDFGKTSLDLIQAGTNSAQQWTKLAETTYDPFIIKTMDQAGTTAANNAGQQATDQYRENVKAGPDPGAAGTFALDTALGMQMLSFGMGAAGGAIGGAGGAAAASGGGRAPATNDWYANAGGSYAYDPATGQYRRQSTTWGGA